MTKVTDCIILFQMGYDALIHTGKYGQTIMVFPGNLVRCFCPFANRSLFWGVRVGGWCARGVSHT